MISESPSRDLELDLRRNQLRIEQQTRNDSHTVVINLVSRSSSSRADASAARPDLAESAPVREKDLNTRVREAGKELEQISRRARSKRSTEPELIRSRVSV